MQMGVFRVLLWVDGSGWGIILCGWGWMGMSGGIGVVAVLDNAHVHFFDTFSPLSSK